MSRAQDCPACEAGRHEGHDRNHGIEEGVIGGVHCACSGGCAGNQETTGLLGRRGCGRCDEYAEVRGPFIRRNIEKSPNGEDPEARWARFMEGVHERHAADVAMGRYAAFLGEVSRLGE